MFEREKWAEIFQSIGRHKMRSALTAFGISWGIFMLVILLGVGNGLQNGVHNLFKDDALNSIWFYPGNARGFDRGFRENRSIEFSLEDAETIGLFDGTDKMSARYYPRSNTIIRYKDKSMTFRMRSVHPDHKYIENTIITDGRFINELDLKENRKSICIGRAVREGLFGEKEAIGEYIEVGGIPFRVVGSFIDEGSEREEQMLYLPITTALKIFQGNERIDQFMVTSQETELKAIEEIESQARLFLSSKYNFNPTDDKAIYINNSFDDFTQLNGLFTSIDIFIWIVGLGSIFAGIIGISNIMLIVVADRRVEIGVRKALGATNRDIIEIILFESVFITSLAGYIGLCSGVFILFSLELALGAGGGDGSFLFNQPEVKMGVVFLALVVLIVAGALAGILPALRATKIKPAESMRK